MLVQALGTTHVNEVMTVAQLMTLHPVRRLLRARVATSLMRGRWLEDTAWCPV